MKQTNIRRRPAAPKKLPVDEVGLIELHTHQTAPEWLADKYLKSGYRVNLSFRKCVRSLFMLHNETFNVWTHLVGWLIFLWLTIYTAFYMTPPSVREHTMNTVMHHMEQVKEVKTKFTADTLSRMEDVLHHSQMLDEINSRLRNVRKCVSGRLAAARVSLRHSVEVFMRESNPLMETPVALSAKLEELVLSVVSEHIQPDEADVVSSILRQRIAGVAGGIESRLGTVQKQLKAQMDAIENIKNNMLNIIEDVRRSVTERYNVHDLEDVKEQVTAVFHNLYNSNLACVTCNINNQVENAKKKLGDAGETVKAKVDWLLHGGYSMSGPFKVSRWPLIVFCITAQICMLASTLFHLFGCHSQHACHCLGCMDFSGISFLIGGSFMPVLYYNFYLEPTIRTVYIVLVGIISATICITSFWPSFHTERFRYVRVGVYVGFGVFATIPVGHLFMQHGISDVTMTLMGELALMSFCYLSGVIFYASRFPESAYPGKFDIWFSSHQWWHICVIFGTYVHYMCVVRCWQSCFEVDSPVASPFLLTN